MLRVPERSVIRRGFTLIEMLVVISIVAILISLTAVAAFRLIGTQQSANTRSELSRVEGEFKKQWGAAAAKYSKESIPTTGPMTAAYNAVLTMAGNDRPRARVIWTKLCLKQAFPTTFAEALNPAPMPPDPTYQTFLSGLGYTTANTTVPQPWESSACLLLALQRGEDGNGVKVEDLGIASSIHDFGPTPNKQTVKGLVDGWGKPIVFVRWPVYLSAPKYGLTGQPVLGFNDADDPTGLLASTSWQATAGCTQFMQFCHGLAPHAKGTEPQTYRIFPIIASGGPNGALGFNPNAVTFPNPAPPAAPTVGSTDADDMLATLAVAQ